MLALLAAGHVFLGLGGGAGDSLASLPRGATGGIMLSADLTLEFEPLIALASLQYIGAGGADAGLASIRAGGFLTRNLYVAGGLGELHENVYTNEDCANGSCDIQSGDGLAFILEAGAVFFRDNRWGRVSVFGQLIAPVFDVAGKTVPLGLAGLRVQL